MFLCDAEFTQKYLETLQDFTKYILRQKVNILSESESFLVSIGKLDKKLSLLIKLNRSKRPLNDNISFDPNIIFPYRNEKLKNLKFYVSLGGVIKLKESCIVEQSINIMIMYRHTNINMNDDYTRTWQCQSFEDGLHILRKFHFDVDMNQTQVDRTKSHFQYGGSFDKNFLGVSENVIYSLFSPLDKPRFPHHPYDFVMLLDFIQREFSLDGYKYTNDRAWRDNVNECENLWLKPYYEKVLDILGKQRDKPIYNLVSDTN